MLTPGHSSNPVWKARQLDPGIRLALEVDGVGGRARRLELAGVHVDLRVLELRQTSSVIEVQVREDDGVDVADVEPEPLQVTRDALIVGHRWRAQADLLAETSAREHRAATAFGSRTLRR